MGGEACSVSPVGWLWTVGYPPIPMYEGGVGPLVEKRAMMSAFF